MVTTRDGGVSTGPYASLNLGLHVGDDPAAVMENRRLAAAALGCGAGRLRLLRAGARLRRSGGRRRRPGSGRRPAPATPAPRRAGHRHARRGPGGDGGGLRPLVLFEPERACWRCVHAGWRGTVRGSPPAAVEAMAGARRRTRPAWWPAWARHRGRPLPGGRRRWPTRPAPRFGGDIERRRPPRRHGPLAVRPVGRQPPACSPTPACPPASIAGRRRRHRSGHAFFSDRTDGPCGRFAAIARLRP